MNTDKKELAVAALRDGTVIDHIPSAALFNAVRFLDLEKLPKAVTIGYNLASKKLGRKGIIKVADTFFDDAVLNRIAIVAPNAVVNTIRDFEVVDKKRVQLPDSLIDIVRCNNPKCITNNEPMRTRFDVVERGDDTHDVKLRCHYCNHTVDGLDAHFK
ncbi:MAG: aspartate carbamoyltransferase regulatory subunit [Muribaculaceae bacterium]|nr:aspartate carbamoyltransferase regulatory subunit [Muribaculaceae bacterium]